MKPSKLINSQCCRASLHTCSWSYCSAFPRFCLGSSDFSERGISKSVKYSWPTLNSSSEQVVWVGRGEGDPQQIAFNVKDKTGAWCIVSKVYGGFFRCLGPECPGQAGAVYKCALRASTGGVLKKSNTERGGLNNRSEHIFKPEISLLLPLSLR